MLRIVRISFVNALLGFTLLSYLFYSETGETFGYLKNPLMMVVLFFFFNVLGWGIVILNKLINKALSWNKKAWLRFLVGHVVHFVFVILLVVIFCSIYTESTTLSSLQALYDQYVETALRIIILTFISIFIFTIVDFALFSYRQYAIVQIEQVRQKREQLELQFEALKTQLSPHFLFNNFNTIYSLINHDNTATEHYIRMLAQTYQYILATHGEKLVSVSREFDFIKSYLYLQEIRFGNSLTIGINDAEDCQNCFVPPLSLQILVENAIKHNSFDETEPLNINILLVNGYIVISNNLMPSPTKSDSLKIGLNNLKKRYSQVTDKKISIDKGSTEFVVKLPIIKSLTLLS